MKFSVLMSVYYKEKVEYFDRAMKSIWDEQTLKPNEIILVQDGKLTDTLYKSIYKWNTKIGDTLKVVVLKENMGLGRALNAGLYNCSFDIVARMDTDDISCPQRFEKQINFLKENSDIDVVGSWISEFDYNENKPMSYRKVPTNHIDIINFGKKRNPINHPSVMYKKEAVMKVVSYQCMLSFEDYYLWVRMIQNGSKMANIPEPLVNMRAGFHILDRRGGIDYIKNEINFQNKLLDIGFIDFTQYIQNITMRTIVRVMPNLFRGFTYKLIRKEKKH